MVVEKESRELGLGRERRGGYVRLGEENVEGEREEREIGEEEEGQRNEKVTRAT